MPNSGFPPLKYIKNTKGKRPLIKDLNIKNISLISALILIFLINGILKLSNMI